MEVQVGQIAIWATSGLETPTIPHIFPVQKELDKLQCQLPGGQTTQ